MSDLLLDDDMNSEKELISLKSKKVLIETGKWTLFIAISGYVLLGLITIIFLFSIFGALNSPFISFGGNIIISFLVYILVLVLTLIPTTFLYNFSTEIKKATTYSKMKNYEKAFDHLKRNFVFVGASSIVILSFYILFFTYNSLGI